MVLGSAHKSEQHNNELGQTKSKSIPFITQSTVDTTHVKIKMMFYKKVLFAFGSCIGRSGAAVVEYSLAIMDKFVDVTSADGKNISRYGSLVNDQLPGPILRAKEGDQFLIYVTNNQASRNAALHWHGLKQTGTPYYDGVPGVAECGISSGSTAVYNFTASPVGTYCELVREVLDSINYYASLL